VELFRLLIVCKVFSEISLFAVYEFSINYSVHCLKIIFSPLFLRFHYITDNLKNYIVSTAEIAENNLS